MFWLLLQYNDTANDNNDYKMIKQVENIYHFFIILKMTEQKWINKYSKKHLFIFISLLLYISHSCNFIESTN